MLVHVHYTFVKYFFNNYFFLIIIFSIESRVILEHPRVWMYVSVSLHVFAFMYLSRVLFEHAHNVYKGIKTGNDN